MDTITAAANAWQDYSASLMENTFWHIYSVFSFSPVFLGNTVVY
jgi:hypothetical protein